MIPISIRTIRADMELKGLSSKDVSNGSGVSYHEVSRLLNGKLTDTEKLLKVVRFITNSPMPEEAAV